MCTAAPKAPTSTAPASTANIDIGSYGGDTGASGWGTSPSDFRQDEFTDTVNAGGGLGTVIGGAAGTIAGSLIGAPWLGAGIGAGLGNRSPNITFGNTQDDNGTVILDYSPGREGNDLEVLPTPPADPGTQMSPEDTQIFENAVDATTPKTPDPVPTPAETKLPEFADPTPQETAAQKLKRLAKLRLGLAQTIKTSPLGLGAPALGSAPGLYSPGSKSKLGQ